MSIYYYVCLNVIIQLEHVMYCTLMGHGSRRLNNHLTDASCDVEIFEISPLKASLFHHTPISNGIFNHMFHEIPEFRTL